MMQEIRQWKVVAAREQQTSTETRCRQDASKLAERLSSLKTRNIAGCWWPAACTWTWTWIVPVLLGWRLASAWLRGLPCSSFSSCHFSGLRYCCYRAAGGSSLALASLVRHLPRHCPSRSCHRLHLPGNHLLLLLHVHSSTCKAINIATFAEHHGVVSLKLYSLSIYLARRCCDVVAIKRQKGMVTRLNPARPLQGWSSLNPYLYRTMHRPNANNPHPHPCHGQVSTAVVPASSSSMVSQSQSPSQPYQSTQTPSP